MKRNTEKSSNPKIKIREMKIDDLAPAFHLGEKLFTFNKVINLYRIWDEYEIVDFFNTSSDYCFTAFVDERFAGFIAGSMVEKKRSHAKYGYLVWIAVDPEFHRHGIASRLFSEFKSRMKQDGATSLIVDTQSDSKEAILFFLSKGFGSPSDHIYLSLNIKSERNKAEKKPKEQE